VIRNFIMTTLFMEIGISDIKTIFIEG